MSGGIAYIFDPNREFHAKCNKESVDLLPLEDEDDLLFMKEALKEFKDETGSEVASKILNNFDEMKTSFIKVFPHEYQRALMEIKAEQQNLEKTSSVAKVNSMVADTKKDTKCKDIADIEDSITNVEMKKRKMDALQNYDKIRGFVKYERENKLYRTPKSRQNDWEEIFDFKHVRKGM